MREQKHMGLLMITQLFLPTKGGTAVSFDDDFRRLGGKEVHIITEDVPGAAEFDLTHPNSIHRMVMKRRSWMKPESLFIYLKLLFKSLQIMLNFRIGAVFAGRALPEGLVALISARMTGRPVLIYAHGEELTGWGRGIKFRVMQFVLCHANWLLSNSDNTSQTLVQLIGADSQRIVTVYPTIDEKRFKPGPPSDNLRSSIGLSQSEKLILSVGRLMERKGFDMIIRALPALLRKGIDTHYAVIGIGYALDRLQRLASEVGVENRVHFLGHVSYEDLPRWYNSCDVFAMPNRDINGDSEGFGLVFLEAAASGKPALSGTAGGTGSAVIHEKTGLRVDGEDIEEVVGGLTRLLLNERELKEMGNNARRRVIRNFIHERRIEQLRNLTTPKDKA